MESKSLSNKHYDFMELRSFALLISGQIRWKKTTDLVVFEPYPIWRFSQGFQFISYSLRTKRVWWKYLNDVRCNEQASESRQTFNSGDFCHCQAVLKCCGFKVHLALILSFGFSNNYVIIFNFCVHLNQQKLWMKLKFIIHPVRVKSKRWISINCKPSNLYHQQKWISE